MLTEASEFSKKFDLVLRFLSFRTHSEYEINEYMLRKGWSEETRKMVLEKLKNLQLIDDEVFARQWLASRTHGRPAGRSLVKMELRKKGIAKEIIDELLTQERGSASEEMLAEKYGRKKLERLIHSASSGLEVKKKLYSALSMRGFNQEVIYRTVEKLLKKE